MIWSPLGFSPGHCWRRRDQAAIEAEQKQQDAADQVEMGMRGLRHKILPVARHDAEQEQNHAHTHHQRSDHRGFLCFVGIGKLLALTRWCPNVTCSY
jgi:ferric-dicitrate binding protein FerR (iron transport regulator)